jgi:hypothetical protein
MPGWRTPLVAALALTITAASLAAPAVAAPAAPMAPGVARAEAGSAVTQVHRYRRYHHYGRGRGVGVGIGLGIIGGILATEAYRSAPGYAYDEDVYDGPPPGFSGDPRELCARNFRSFEWNTGLYTTYSGEKKLCPYLR